MYKMVNRYGNVFKNVKSVREKEELERQGYSQVVSEGLKGKPANRKRSNDINKTVIQNNEKGENN